MFHRLKDNEKYLKEFYQQQLNLKEEIDKLQSFYDLSYKIEFKRSDFIVEKLNIGNVGYRMKKFE